MRNSSTVSSTFSAGCVKPSAQRSISFRTIWIASGAMPRANIFSVKSFAVVLAIPHSW